jgi:hypothetical protein
MTSRINSRAFTLLREWYFRTREANFKSCYPAISVRWEKCGLAWQSVGIGFELSRCTLPKELMGWEEAGHQFCKLDELQQALIIGRLFHRWGVTELAAAAKIPKYIAHGYIRVGLRRYEDMCLDAGIIEPEDDDLAAYLSGAKQIGAYLGVSAKTVRRWALEAGLPVKKVFGGGVLAHKDEIDLWFMESVKNPGRKKRL